VAFHKVKEKIRQRIRDSAFIAPTSIPNFKDTVGRPRTSAALILEPHPHDVLLGRKNKGAATHHSGNQVFRSFCWNACQQYMDARVLTTIQLADTVIQQVKSRSPPGRFLECKPENGGYLTEVPLNRVRDNISQVLRRRKRQISGLQRPYRTPLDQNGNFGGVQEPPQSSPTQEGPGAPSTAEPPHARHITTNNTECMHGSHTTAAQMTSEPPATCLDPQDLEPPDFDPRMKLEPDSRISIYSPLDKTYYKATVVERIHSVVFLRYDDEAIEWVDLTKYTFKVLDANDDEKDVIAAIPRPNRQDVRTRKRTKRKSFPSIDVVKGLIRIPTPPPPG